MLTQLPWQPDWNVSNSFVLSQFEFMFGMEVPWSDQHQPHTLLLWELSYYGNQSEMFMFGIEVP